jgi:GTP-binding protein
MLEAGAPADDLDHPAQVEFGRRLFAQPCVFIAGIAELARLPPAGLPEAAFAGRSNVGKSSLINALTGQHHLARTSNTPGRTQQINLFELGGRLILADLPGYGYARAPKDAAAGWQRMVRDYLRGRSVLQRVCLLIDARHGAKASDREIMGLLGESAVAFQAVLTKSDLVGARDLADGIVQLRRELERTHGAHPEVIATSARSGAGIERLRAALATLAEPE